MGEQIRCQQQLQHSCGGMFSGSALLWRRNKSHGEFAKMILEESQCREFLAKLQWLDDLPEDPQLESEMAALRGQAERFCSMFQWQHCARYPLEVLNARLVTVEARGSLDFPRSLGRLPKNVTNPRDRQIRGAASVCCSPFFQGPGNYKWGTIHRLLSLNKYVVLQHADPILRTAPARYGDRSNCSSKGPVNLRGDVLESVLYDLQTLSTVTVGGSKWPTSGASHR